MEAVRQPSLYQMNTRARLAEAEALVGRPATLDDLGDAVLDRLAADGFDWLWLLGVWQTGDAAREVSRTQADWQREYHEVLNGVKPADVCGSPFAVSDYTVHRDFGGPPALERLRHRLADRGLRLMLDFVPNHTALDHPWVRSHPEYYVPGTEEDLAREPLNYVRVATGQGPRILAHGRDPYFPGWPDTLQLNYRHPACRAVMQDVLVGIARQCDGVRCDMAMLVLPEIVQSTWGERALPAGGLAPVDKPFWLEAIARVRDQWPAFVFMAEAYWDLEWALQQQGFDYTYDKRLYDRLHSRDARSVRAHLRADLDYQRHSARFLENHDEPRAAAALPAAVHRAAAVVSYFVPGLRFFHDGQLTGRRIRMSNHLRRRVPEPVDRELERFYSRLLGCLRRPEARRGAWHLLPCRAAWDNNPTWEHFIAVAWNDGAHPLLATVNYGPTDGQCWVALDQLGFDSGSTAGSSPVLLHDLLHPTVSYERDGHDLAHLGLYLDLPPWGHHVFELIRSA